MLLSGMDSLSYGFISGSIFYIINVIYARVIYTHAIDLTDGKCYFTYINLAGVLSEIIVREFLPCIPVLCG